MGGFEDWTETLAGVLRYAGFEGFLENLPAFHEHIDEDEVAWESFLAAWHAAYGDREVTVARITQDLVSNGRSSSRPSWPCMMPFLRTSRRRW